MKWIPVEKELPADRVDVLVLRDIGDIRIGYVRVWSDGAFWVVPKFEEEKVVEWKVTHWQPLPNKASTRQGRRRL